MANNVQATAGTGTTFKTTDTAGVHTGHVNVDSSALPTGAATETTLDAVKTAVEGTVTISGTVTANLGATDNAVLDSIQTAVELIDNAISGTEMQVDVVTSALPTGAATAAKQPALGTAGTASSDVISVQGIASGTALTISGTVTADAGAGSISAGTAGTPASDVLSVQGITSMTALVVDGSGVTQPVSASSLPLPTGASTAAKQPALGTAGTASSDVISVQGIASMTALVVDGSAVTQPVSGTAIDTQSYETVAASQTAQALGATGATGDYLAHVLIVPATTSPGAVSIKDGAGAAITIFTGGADSVSNLIPFAVPVNAVSGAGAWQVTTGTNVSAIGVGTFT